eukprot:TRINITY_DN1039_c0_g1_i1.p1 TRINITY_DN1039_c0_g1~~TRINITY_DN1039_c0_g1_i1.p1  ORF type:complete len:162 (+),score=32.82 TRINITY_DN1039_c0_g1_i1:55-540(+)
MATVPQNAPLPVLKSIFMKYDKDNSGKIGPLELKDLCYELGFFVSIDNAGVLVKRLDTDGEGLIGLDEFINWWRDPKKFEKITSSERNQQSLKYFQYFDTDKSGSINSEEYAKLHSDLIKNNLIHPTVTAEQGLKIMDKTGDGNISFSEFMDYMDTVQTPQ